MMTATESYKNIEGQITNFKWHFVVGESSKFSIILNWTPNFMALFDNILIHLQGILLASFKFK